MILSIIWNIAAFIVTLGVLIIVHEFGHFLVARFYGVKIERFSIGFGKKLWSKKDLHGTEFIIAMIPIGGYVKMLDEDMEKLVTQDISITKKFNYFFNNKPVYQRAAIIAAGPIANFIFAIFVYWLVFIINIPSIRPIVGEIVPNSIAAKAQIYPGVEIKAIDGIKTPDWNAVLLQLVSKIGYDSVKVRLAQFGSNKITETIIDLHKSNFEQSNLLMSLGIIPYGELGLEYIEPILTEVQADSAAQKAGLQVGDKIVKVNNKPLNKWMMFVNLVRKNPGKQLLLEVERQGRMLSFILIPDYKQGHTNNSIIEGFAGLVPKLVKLPDKYKIIRDYGLFRALFEAIYKTCELIKLTVNMLIKLISNEININHINGPILIAQRAGVSAELGVIYYLMFLALISINLGIINFLPVPILDGGHLLFLIFEKLKGSQISDEIKIFSYRVGSLLLILLMGVALFNDCYQLLIK